MRQNGEEMTTSLQVISNGQVFLSAANPKWKLAPQTSMPAKYAIDGEAMWEGNAFAPLESMIIIALPASPDAADALAAGKSLSASVEGGSAKYDLAGAASARDMLKVCLARRVISKVLMAATRPGGFSSAPDAKPAKTSHGMRGMAVTGLLSWPASQQADAQVTRHRRVGERHRPIGVYDVEALQRRVSELLLAAQMPDAGHEAFPEPGRVALLGDAGKPGLRRAKALDGSPELLPFGCAQGHGRVTDIFSSELANKATGIRFAIARRPTRNNPPS